MSNKSIHIKPTSYYRKSKAYYAFNLLLAIALMFGTAVATLLLAVPHQ
jgi:hypothetical protein